MSLIKNAAWPRLRPWLPLAALALGIIAVLALKAKPQLGIWLFASGGLALTLARPEQGKHALESGGLPERTQPMQAWEPWFLGALVVLGGAFRLYGLTDFPTGAQGYEGEMVDQLKLIENQPYTPHINDLDTLWPSTLFYQGLAFAKLLGWRAYAFRIPAALWGLLSLPLFYFLVRMVTAAWVAAVATLLFNASQLHLALSRSFFPGSILWVSSIAALALLIIAMRQERRLYFLLAGFAAGLSLHGYVPGRMVGPLFLIWLTWLCFFSPKKRLDFKSLLLFACGYLACGLPIIWWAMSHWSRYWEYIGSHNPYHGKPLGTYLSGFLRELPTYARWFHVQGDPSSSEDIARHPALDPVTGVLFPLGFFYCLFSCRRPVYAFMLALLAAGLACAAMGGGFAHPTGRRLILILPAIFFMSAMSLERLRLSWEANSRKKGQIILVLIASGLALWVNGRSWDWYFNKYSQDPRVKGQRDYLAHLAGQEMWAHPNFSFAVSPLVNGFSASGILFPRDISPVIVRNLGDIVASNPEKNLMLLMESWSEAFLPPLKILYPSMKYRIHTCPNDATPAVESPFMLAIEIPREELLAQHGLRLRATGQALRVFENPLPESLRGRFLVLEGSFFMPEQGGDLAVGFSWKNWNVTVDGQLVPLGKKLKAAGGIHRISLSGRFERGLTGPLPLKLIGEYGDLVGLRKIIAQQFQHPITVDDRFRDPAWDRF